MSKCIIRDREATFTGKAILSEDFIKAMHDYDLAVRPLAIICNPAQEAELKEQLGNNYLYVSNPCVPEDRILVYDRRKAEEGYLDDLHL